MLPSKLPLIINQLLSLEPLVSELHGIDDLETIRGIEVQNYRSN